jgi:hypothetical protein
MSCVIRLPRDERTERDKFARILEAEKAAEDRRGQLAERAQAEIALEWACTNSAKKGARAAENVDKRKIRRRRPQVLATAEGALNGL